MNTGMAQGTRRGYGQLTFRSEPEFWPSWIASMRSLQTVRTGPNFPIRKRYKSSLIVAVLSTILLLSMLLQRSINNWCRSRYSRDHQNKYSTQFLALPKSAQKSRTMTALTTAPKATWLLISPPEGAFVKSVTLSSGLFGRLFLTGCP